MDVDHDEVLADEVAMVIPADTCSWAKTADAVYEPLTVADTDDVKVVCTCAVYVPLDAVLFPLKNFDAATNVRVSVTPLVE